MSPEEIARRHEELGGFELVDYAKVALPFWQLSVEAISVAHKRLPPIQEFTLRSLRSGLAAAELGGFLGLDSDIMDGTLAQLLVDRLIRPVSNADESDTGDVQISPEGIRALEEDGVSSPIEEQFVLLFDGIFRQPSTMPSDQVLLPKEASRGPTVEIGAVPSTKPDVTDLTIADVESVLIRETGDRAEFGRTILRLKRISRYRRLFRKAVALVFKSTTGAKELRIKFIVGGVREELLEQRFAENGGLSRAGFVRAFSDSYLNANLRKHLGPEISGSIFDGDEFIERRTALSFAKIKLSSANRRARALISERGAADTAVLLDVKRAEEAVRTAELALKELIARPAAVYEQMEAVQTALKLAKNSISISSSGLANWLVDKTFLMELKAKLADGLHFELRLDQLTYDRAISHAPSAQLYIEFQKLADQYKNCVVKLWREVRYFHLAIDDKYLLVSNRPMLSQTTRSRVFEQYSGYVVQSPPLISLYLQRVRKGP